MKKLPIQKYSNFGELQSIIKDKNSVNSPLVVIEKHFNTKQISNFFIKVKQKGVSAMYLFNILIIMPFIGTATIYALCKNKIRNDIKSEKDGFYSLKKDTSVAWRSLLFMIVKRFRYLVNTSEGLKFEAITAIIFDDTTTRKRGRTIEKVSRVWDHVEGISVLGFKVLVMGYWDGTGFIPLDFSIHREKNREHTKIKKQIKKAEMYLLKLYNQEEEIVNQIDKLKDRIKQHRKQTNNKTIKEAQEKQKKNKIRKQKLLKTKRIEIENTKSEIKKIQKVLSVTSGYGLTKKEEAKQYKKKREAGSPGLQRIKECDIKKTENAISMFKRAVKHGIITGYVLTDSWFFSYSMVKATRESSKYKTHFVGMAPMGKQLYSIEYKEYKASELVKKYKEQSQNCRKLRAKYIKKQAKLKDIDINMFFVKLSKRDKWKLLVTTNLKLTFIQIMQIYQLRWSIEVFFKESKQYLDLGKCQSTDFDSQIAETTIKMIQYILLSFYKRIHYQNTIGGIFKTVSKQTVELNLAEKLWSLFIQLQQAVSEISGINIYELFIQALSDTRAEIEIKKIIDLFAPEPDLGINKKKAA